MKATFIVAFAGLLSVSAISATAQNKQGLQDEQQRIHQGVESGQLTHREASRLNTQKVQLHNEAIRYKANDGKIGPRERADLKRDNKRLSRNIYCQKHDKQKRF